jgi:hypothetical protein
MLIVVVVVVVGFKWNHSTRAEASQAFVLAK